jgi:5-methylthioadenosine/S-adenosylhomocysteine deaminase
MVSPVRVRPLRHLAPAAATRPRSGRLHGNHADPYQQLLHADERDITLVMIAGVPRYGTRTLVTRLGGQYVEAVRVAGRQRVVNLRQETADPIVGTIAFSEAKQRLTEALKNLKQLAKQAEKQPQRLALTTAGRATGPERWGLALDELQPTGYQIRPRLPLRGRFALTGPSPALAAEAEAAAPLLSEVLGPLKLDPLTVAGSDWVQRIDAERNFPAWAAPGLRELYPAA